MVICVAGESGSGKTTSCRNLDPQTTYYIDCDKKGLSWKGWRSQYSVENKNYFKTDDPEKVMYILRGIQAGKMPSTKTVVIDTINGIMVADEMRRSKEKGFDKWQDLAASVYSIVDMALTLPDDMVIIFIAHTQTERDDSGYSFTRIKTSGKKLDKIVLESKFTNVLIAKCIDGNYILETHANHSTAKTPMGAFEENFVENDIVKVIEALREF